jgi:hypothetical protein
MMRSRVRDRSELDGGRNARDRYRGYGRPKEKDHDAGVNRAYREISRDVERRGGRVVAARTEQDIMRLLRSESALRGRGRALDAQERNQLAEDLGLRVIDSEIRVPDIQLLIERKSGEEYVANVECVSGSYSSRQINQKLRAGFELHETNFKGRRVRPGPDIAGSLIYR